MNTNLPTVPPPPREQDAGLPQPSSPAPDWNPPSGPQSPGYQDGQGPPGKLEQPSRRGPPRAVAAWTIIALNVLLWLVPFILPFLGGSPDRDLLLRLGAKINPLIVQGEIWRLVTPVFLHVNLTHLAFNTYAIYVIGPQIEQLFGTPRFLSIYLLSGIYGVLFSFVFSPQAAAGASGAIFGLIGTQAVFLYRYRDVFGRRGQRQLYSTLSVIAFNLVLTFSTPGIDIWGHVGGLLAGALLGWGVMPRYTPMMTYVGPKLVDRQRPAQWGMVVLGAFLLLAVSTWIAITVRASGSLSFSRPITFTF